jgi:hypothetical protein
VIQIKKNLDVYLGLKKNKKLIKKSKALHRAFRKTNRIVEGTIIKEILYPKLILGLTEN